MDEFISPDLLETNADSIKQESYAKPLSKEEMQIAKDDFTELCIQQDKLEDAEQERREEYKMEVDPVKKKKKILLGEIRTGVRERTGKVYYFADMEEGMMGKYDEDGDLISQRPLLPGEKQFRIGRAANE